MSAGAVILALLPRYAARTRPQPSIEVPGWARRRRDSETARGLSDTLQGLAAVATALLGGLVSSALLGAWGWLCAPVTGVIGFVVLGHFEPAGIRRRRKAVAADLPGTLELMAACLEAGAPLRQAVHEVAVVSSGEIAATLLRLDAMVRVGMSDSDAWHSLVTDSDWSATARDLARSASTGSGVAQILREHAGDCRAEHHRRQEAMARTVGVRSVMPLMCCFLPAFVLVGVIPIIAGTVSSLLHR